MPDLVTDNQFTVATFNLFNYLEPPNAYYEFQRIYSAEQWQKKQNWLIDYLQAYQPDIIGFQEVFSVESLKNLVASQGYRYFAVVDEAEVIEEFIYRSPVVAIASRLPIVEVVAVKPDLALAQAIGLSSTFSFSRKVLRATIDVPHLGNCDCYVVHFKSKRSILEHDENRNHSPEKNIIESLKAQVAGGWGASIQRGSEAALLMVEMITRRETSNNPMILLGDFNNNLADGVLNHLLTNALPFVSSIDRDTYLEKYCLNDAWDLFQAILSNETNNSNDENEISQEKINGRSPSHYYGATSAVLDYILLSSEFDASNQASLYQVSNYHTYDRHLINPIFARDGESTDHAIVMVTLTLRA
ncbi:Endonuclease/Exonuclease/phosphatase family protein [Colwellia chukchiensis]|uniref:Endonuclease/Exonuclease/phosphatase family protein n=1 Tax=Colwellia chukchiensis TaxID=641665 RepID=A0A1H7Q887_9GAMM|nr:endonuclease/exonuclease/phosphatase family protein [Colwellia chukchiensis]SEL44213.1 Endonuclease/Exonuclease/phosphatase family protein [Colwellia chukchiensis]